MSEARRTPTQAASGPAPAVDLDPPPSRPDPHASPDASSTNAPDPVAELALIPLAHPPADAIAPTEHAPLGAAPDTVAAWFDKVADAALPDSDGTLAAARLSAQAWSRRAKAANTREAYRWAVRAWCAWCNTHGLSPLPGTGADVAAFLAGERALGRSPNTLDLRRAAIRYLHHAAGCPSPTGDALVGATLAGIRRAAPNPAKKRAATLAVLRDLLAPIPDDLPGQRDRALLLVGFAGALRRAELAAIALADLVRTDQGFELTLARSKGAQTAPVTVPLPYGRTALCPVRALTAWLAAAAITDGPVFRRIWVPPAPPDGPPALPRLGASPLTPRSIARIVQVRATAAGFGRLEFGGHSLKRGALTTGMTQRAHAVQLKRLGRHKTFDVLGEYLEFGDLFEDHPLSGVL
jgi:integrase